MAKKHFTLALASVVSFGLLVQLDSSESNDMPPPSTEETTPSYDVMKLSKAFGHLIGRNLETPGVTFDLDSIIAGMRDAAAGLEAPMSETEYEEAMSALQESAFNRLAETNLQEANEFLKKNSKETNVINLEQGKVQYKVLSEGLGKSVSEHGNPTINYKGSYSDGTLFGSSEETGPIALPLDQTIPGFAKGIVGMKEGEKRQIYIHPDMGYGVMGHLPPNSLLIFEVEVVRANSMDGFDSPVAEGDIDEFNEEKPQ